MKVIVAGSRTIVDMHELHAAIILSEFEISEIVSGGARGVDQLGELWASSYGIPVKRFLPEWNKLGRSAGHARNIEMADYADALIAIWDGKSRGTKHMVETARYRGMKVFVHEAKPTFEG
jgi:hypothetical protein